MRKISAVPTLRPTARGFLLLSTAFIAVLGLIVPAHATTVTVKLHISVGGNAGAVKECSGLAVTAGAGGSAVLAAAQRSGCIRSYQIITFPEGSYVSCIDPTAAPLPATPVCQQADGLATFWAYYKNGVMQDVGIDGFNAKAGDDMTLAYTNFLLCPTYPSCPI